MKRRCDRKAIAIIKKKASADIALKIEPLRILFELLNFGVKSLQLHVVFNAGFARIMEPALKKIRSQGRFTQQVVAELYF